MACHICLFKGFSDLSSGVTDREKEKKRLIELEAIFHAAWTGSGSSPFIPEVPLKKEILSETHELVRRFVCAVYAPLSFRLRGVAMG
jgi:hypothetical protein